MNEHRHAAQPAQGRLVRICVNPLGGVPKLAVPQAVVSFGGVVGDRQRDLRYHGGPERAVCLYSLEVIEALQREGHPIRPGSTGENLTLSGLPWTSLQIGTKLQVGNDVRLEIASFVTPCHKIGASFLHGDFSRVSVKLNSGWTRLYARVLREGLVQQGDLVKCEMPGL